MLLAAVAILVLGSITLAILNRFSLRIGYAWFLAVGASLSAWVLVLLSYPAEPNIIFQMNWQVSAILTSSPGLILDSVSWPYAVAIGTLLIAVLLTDVARLQEINAGSWAVALALTGAGILGVTAENPLTLLLAWALIDLSETTTLLLDVTDSKQSERVVITFFVRVFGLLLVVAAMVRAKSAGLVLALDAIPVEGAGYLILAAGLRLGVFPPHPPFFQEGSSRRGVATILRLVPVAASLMLVTRVASTGLGTPWVIPLMVISVWSMASGVITWITSPNELDGRPFWILALSSYAMVAAIQAQPIACLAWGLSSLFSGGVLFLYSTRSTKLAGLPIAGLVGISALPFTPAWRGTDLFFVLHPAYSLFFLLGMVTLIAGYYKHMMRVDSTQPDIERWAWLVYPTGLALLPLSHWYVIWLGGSLSLPIEGFRVSTWLSGIVVLALAWLFWIARHRIMQPANQILALLRQTLPLDWFYRFLWWSYRSISRFMGYLGQIFEGEGGVLWAVLIIILLVLITIRPDLGV
jgi:hypothetical protein